MLGCFGKGKTSSYNRKNSTFTSILCNSALRYFPLKQHKKLDPSYQTDLNLRVVLEEGNPGLITE